MTDHKYSWIKFTIIQPTKKAVPHSIHLKKPFSFQKAVLIRKKKKGRPHSTLWKKVVLIRPQSKKPSSFGPVEKAIFIQFSEKSRSHSIQSKKLSSFQLIEKAALIQPSRKSPLDESAAKTIQLRKVLVSSLEILLSTT
jgi:hypothetical protein